MTIVINFHGGPGAGKSTAAAYVFSLLKWQGIKTELITEYATDRVWEGSFNVLKHQEYVYAKQKHRMWRCADQVDVIVTDAPLLHCMYYDQTHNGAFTKLIMQAIEEFDNINVFVERVDDHYQTEGRTQDLQEARHIDGCIWSMVMVTDPHNYQRVVGQEDALRDHFFQKLLPRVQELLQNPEPESVD